MKRKTYIAEIEWAIGEMICAFNDRNPNRQAQMDGLLAFANAVLIARRSHVPMTSYQSGPTSSGWYSVFLWGGGEEKRT